MTVKDHWLLHLYSLDNKLIQQAVTTLWTALQVRVKDIKFPTERPIPTKRDMCYFQLMWSRLTCYLNIDITPDGKFDWFFMDTHFHIVRSGKGEVANPSEELVQLFESYVKW